MTTNQAGGAAPSLKLYCVPRRYDLATLFTVSFAYAILFGVMRACEWRPSAFGLVAGFVTFVGLCQALFFRGRMPRVASLIGGALFYASAAAIFLILAGRLEYAFYSIPCCLLGGAFCGYVVGVLIGGVFLVADVVRRIIARLTRKSEDEN